MFNTERHKPHQWGFNIKQEQVTRKETNQRFESGWASAKPERESLWHLKYNLKYFQGIMAPLHHTLYTDFENRNVFSQIPGGVKF